MKLLTTLGLLAAMATPALAEDMTIEMLNKRDDGAKMVYSEDIARVDVGDTITWVPTAKGHNVEFIAGPQMNALPKNSKINNFHSVEFKTPGVYLYGCTPHLNMGMLGLIIVGDDLHNLEKIRDVKLSRIAKSVLDDLIKIAKSYPK